MTPRVKSVLGWLLVLGVAASFGAVTVINLATQVTGVLPGANGGTGVSSTATFPASGTVMTTAASVACAQQPALTGDITSSAGSCATAIGVGVIANGDLGAGSYIKGVFRAFCTGTATASVTNYVFAGFGGKVSTCADSTGTTASGGMKMPSAGTLKNLYVNLSAGGKSGDKVTMLKNGSATGAPTCTYSTGTTCNDVSTALAVAAGDIITISVTSGASDGSANIAVAFEFWN